MADNRNVLICRYCRYFNEGLSYADIVRIMSQNHDISLSLRHLHRNLRSLGLWRRDYSDTPPVVHFIVMKLKPLVVVNGYQMMRQRCMANGFQVRTQDVSTILRIYDPIGKFGTN